MRVALRSAYDQGDFGLLANITHTFKGVSANLSATQLNADCIELETAIHNKDNSVLDTVVKKVESAHSTLIVHFEAYLKSNSWNEMSQFCVPANPKMKLEY